MAVEPLILTNGTTADANEVMALFNEIYTNIDPSNVQSANKTGTGPFVLGTGATLTNPIINGGTINAAGVVPVGTILAFYDFNGLVTFDTAYYTYCNGAVISNPSSPLNGQTLPDISGRALVGFGTDGGGDIGTATWATAAVGNAGNIINIAHSHTVASHTHDMQNHTHTGAVHTHDIAGHTHSMSNHVHFLGDDGWAQLSGQGGGPSSGDILIRSVAASIWTSNVRCDSLDQVAGETSTQGVALDGATDGPNTNSTGVTPLTTDAAGAANTGVPSTNTTSAASPGTDSQLSATQSIQPISIRVRYIMRIV